MLVPILLWGQTWDYPIKPGTDEWKRFETHAEKVSSCQIPVDVLKKIPTDELIELCLNYPLSFDYYAYNSVSEGIINVRGEFNGLEELFHRKDNFSTAQKMVDFESFKSLVQSNRSVEEKGAVVYRLTLLETLLSFDEFMENSNMSGLQSLKKEVVKMLEYKRRNSDLFSNYSNSASALFAWKDLEDNES